MRTIDNTVKVMSIGSDNVPFTIQFDQMESKPAKISDLIRLLLMRLPVETMDDAVRGVRLVDMLTLAPVELKFEEADYVWLKIQLEKHGPTVLGLMAVRLKEALDVEEDV